MLILHIFLIRDVTRFVTSVAQRVPHVLTLPTFLIRDVTRFVTRVAQRVPHIKGVIRCCKSKDEQHNDQRKMTNNDLQNITQTIKDQSTQTPLKTGDELRKG
jgi:hypothetical protein